MRNSADAKHLKTEWHGDGDEGGGEGGCKSQFCSGYFR